MNTRMSIDNIVREMRENTFVQMISTRKILALAFDKVLDNILTLAIDPQLNVSAVTFPLLTSSF